MWGHSGLTGCLEPGMLRLRDSWDRHQERAEHPQHADAELPPDVPVSQ